MPTITSQLEDSFFQSNFLGSGKVWLSGTDEVVEGSWHWVGGAENGLQFWQGVNTGYNVNNLFFNWGGTEPNSSADYSNIWFSGWDDNATTWAYVIEWDAGLMAEDNAADLLDGDAGDDTIYGYGGNDIIDGGADNDLILAGSGSDTVTGGTGSDALHGGFDLTLERIIYNPHADANDYFGLEAVAIFGDYAVIGAYQDNTNGTDAGIAFIYNVTDGSLVHTLANPNPESTLDDHFARQVAINSKYVLAGAHAEDDDAGNAGACLFI